MSAGELTRRLKSEALGRGFDLVAVAAAEPLDRDRRALQSWLRGDRQASMIWMARDPTKRADPGRLLPGCRSVVALAMNYWPGRPRAAVPEGRAPIAVYARGRDYHKILGKRARELAAWLEREAGRPARSFVDTGPVLERAWAERAGVGWIGKNANLIHRELGSWLLLAEILTAAELEPDPGPHEEFCGTCTACLDACPTGAIVAPGVVDSNSCISYWTIEHRGTIPAERRAGIGEWLFGCDVCQSVCPWNQSFAREAVDSPLEFRDDLRGLDPEELLALDEATFRARYSGTALMRAKWEGMRRNACVVLGNRRNPRSLPALGRALGDADPVLRAHAAWAAGRIGGSGAMAILRQALGREADPAVRREIVHALASTADLLPGVAGPY
jgi:epoxyqueuosine reductase